MTKAFNWKVFFILLAGATLGLVAIVPYALTLQGPVAPTDLPMPMAQVIAIQIAAQVIVFGAAIGVGLSFANSIGLGLPILEARLLGKDVAEMIRAVLPISLVVGVIAALLITGLDAYVFQPALTAQLGEKANLLMAPGAKPEAWKGFLASFYGAINEEILLRLCVMSFLAWVGRSIGRTAQGNPTVAVLWSANILAALLLGLGHLPATSLLVPLMPLVVVRGLVLNGLAGVGFGWLYFRHGLESAMLAHFSTDIVLHVLFAL